AVDEDAVAAAVVLDEHPVGPPLEPGVDPGDVAAFEPHGAGLAAADGGELGDLERLPAERALDDEEFAHDGSIENQSVARADQSWSASAKSFAVGYRRAG